MLKKIAASTYPKCAYDDNYPVLLSRSFDNEIVTPKVLKIAIHALRNIDGSGGSDLTALLGLTESALNESFTNTSLSFEIISTDYINYFTIDLRNKFSFSDETTLTPIYNLDRSKDRLHIYFIDHALNDEEASESVAGITQSIPGNACIVDSYFAKLFQKTIGHELGHCLGLYHTFKGTERYVAEKYNLSTKGESGVPELVNGSNSDISGDYMSDTPADPNVCWGQNGYFGGDRYKDANGDIYNPQKYNIMCYSWDASRFTAQQIKRMHSVIRNELSFIQLKADIKGPLHFSTNASYSCDIPIGRNFEWNVIRHTHPSADDTPPIKSENKYSESILNLTSSDSELIEIQLLDNLTNSNLSSLLVTAGPPSPTTGTLYWKTSELGAWEGATSNMEWGKTLYISENKNLYIEYSDRSGAKRTDIEYRTVTATNRVLSGSKLTITPADCAQGYLKFRLSDSSGQGFGYFTIPISIIGRYYAANVNDNSTVTFTSNIGDVGYNQNRIKQQAAFINNIKIVNSTGHTIFEQQDLTTDCIVIKTNGWPNGEYCARLSDGENFTQDIYFCV